MRVKKFEEYCENCGCPLDICCKPKQPVVSLQAIRDYCKKNMPLTMSNGEECYLLDPTDLLSWAEKEAKGGKK